MHNNMENDLQQEFETLKDYTERKIQLLEESSGSKNSSSGTVYLASDQANNGTIAKVLFDTELFTTSGITWDSTNNRFTATVAGKYLVTAIVYWGNPAVTNRYAAYIYKTNTLKARSQLQCSMGSNDLAVSIHRIFSLAVGDYIEIWAGHTDGPNSYNIAGAETYSYMSICKV